MPRRGGDREALEPPKKRLRSSPEQSLDVSYTDNEALPPGIMLTDLMQKQWRVGKPIGRGSFGRIYLASDRINEDVTKENARYVVKMEPHSNGPLFVEIHCFLRTAKIDKIKGWRSNNKQKRIGMPPFIASGSYIDEATKTKYRFLVLPRYCMDLQKIIHKRGKALDLRNVLILAVQILDVLEYLHNNGYTHSDIKSSNLMVGFNGDKSRSSIGYDIFNDKVDKIKEKKVKKFSSYYNDEDFVVNYKTDEDEYRKPLTNMKKNLRTILNDRDKRRLHRHHAFNLRQLHSHVNYTDINSSICSDVSYQTLLEDDKKPAFVSPKNIKPISTKSDSISDGDEKYNEAILSQSSGQIYLLDYGLASKFVDSQGNHKEFGMDARKAHDGTLEYSSRDSHIGAHSRRSDFETLGFNLIDWLTGTLPWKTAEMLSEPDLVHCLKKSYMQDVASLLKTCFKTELYPQFMGKYLQYVVNLEFTEKPDYDYCRNIFKTELLRNGYGGDRDMNLRLSEPKSPLNLKKLSFSKRLGPIRSNSSEYITKGVKICERENISGQSLENELKLQLLKKALNNSNDSIRKPCTSRNFYTSEADLVARLKRTLLPLESFGKRLSPKNLRSKKRGTLRKKTKKNSRSSIGKFGSYMGFRRPLTWAEVLALNPENIIRKERNLDTEETDNSKRSRKYSDSSDTSETQSALLQKDYLENLNPTYAMKEVFNNFRNKNSSKVCIEEPEILEIAGYEGYTPAMIQLIKMIENRTTDEEEEARYLLNEVVVKEETVFEPKETKSRKKESEKREIVTVREKRTRKKDSTKTSDEINSQHQLTKNELPYKNKASQNIKSQKEKASSKKVSQTPKKTIQSKVKDTETKKKNTSQRKTKDKFEKNPSESKTRSSRSKSKSVEVNVKTVKSSKSPANKGKIIKNSEAIQEVKCVTAKTKAKRKSSTTFIPLRRSLRSSKRNKTKNKFYD